MRARVSFLKNSLNGSQRKARIDEIEHPIDAIECVGNLHEVSPWASLPSELLELEEVLEAPELAQSTVAQSLHHGDSFYIELSESRAMVCELV